MSYEIQNNNKKNPGFTTLIITVADSHYQEMAPPLIHNLTVGPGLGPLPFIRQGIKVHKTSLYTRKWMRAALIVTQTSVHDRSQSNLMGSCTWWQFSKQKAQSSPIYPEAYDALLI